jgi:signal transduction histidine kinase
MKLSAFITTNIEQIAADWEKFAATLLPEEEFSASILRNGIVDMLKEIALDMDHAQSAEQQQGKSEGDLRPAPHIEDAAERHALARVKMGLSSRQLISEFRALRATVIRLWQREIGEVDRESLYDLTRFNEAVDQALSEAAVRFSEEIERSREVFLGILGHDLRNPLAAISGWAELQMRAKTRESCSEFARHIFISSGRMSHMITDLIELTRVRLGAGIIVNRTLGDLYEICTKVILEMEAIYPDRDFRMVCDGAVLGEWDADRMSQVVSNLLGNAIQHGAVTSSVTLSVKKEGNIVELAVHNKGTPIPVDSIPKLFDCLFQGRPNAVHGDEQSTSLGLGLYIAREIVEAHGGTIGVSSSGEVGTTFTACMPCATSGEWRGASQPRALSEPDVTLSRHPAPII